MKLSILKENYPYEKRVALTPDVTKKVIELGFTVSVETNAGHSAGYSDDAFEKAGACVEKDRKKLLSTADYIVTVSPLDASDLPDIKKGATLLGTLKPFKHKELFNHYINQKLTTFALEMIPRITRAQTMDILSSQSNLAGYKAVIEASNAFGRAFPLMMTAAGTIKAAKVLILGAGVAGLQAIATAKRLGAIVSAFDVRSAAKEQVMSLGATFVEVAANEIGDGAGGYAKEMSDAYKIAQMAKLADVIKTHDIVITTALIPGKPAPVLITSDMVKSMKEGSVIVDLASENGGNCALSEHGKNITKHGVHIHAPGNILAHIAADASQLYARNVLAFLKGVSTVTNGDFALNWDDEIALAAALTKDGIVINPLFQMDSSETTAFKESIHKEKASTEKSAAEKSAKEKPIKEKAVTKKPTTAKKSTPQPV